MAYEVLARKWRPQQFGDVVGQEHVTSTLCNAIKQERVAHAYLFVGPRGIGKTSISRILAKALNCRKGPTPDPCDVCDACTEIMAGNAMDVMEIDGASNNSVDQVRDLRDNVRYAPVRGPYKIYIIDEVHMLSIAAFNALLKTLEEPPPHVKFIFATTEPQKVPTTIASRCQRFDLRRIPTRAIMGHLETIAKAEGIALSANALLAIARGAEGGLRDAESALDQLISFRGKQIEEEDVLSVFGLVSRDTLESLALALLTGDAGTVVQRVDELDRQGKDMQRLLVELLEHFRNVLVCLCAGESSEALDLSDEQKAVLRAHAGKTDLARLLRVTEILVETTGSIRHALSARTMLEMALIRCSRAATVISIEQILTQLNAFKDALGRGEPMEPEDARQAPPLSRPTPPSTAERTPMAARPPAVDRPRPTPASATPAPATPEAPALSDEAALTRLRTQWKEITERLGTVQPRLRMYLPNAYPATLADHALEIGFDPEFEEDFKLIDTATVKNTVQKVLTPIVGRALDIRFVLRRPPVIDAVTESEAPSTSTDPSPPPPRASAAGPAAPAAQKKTTDELRKQLLSDPSVQRFMDLFDGSISEIRE